MTGGIMIAAAAYLWKRWRQKEGAEAAVMLFALVFLYPILAGGSMEKIWLGYLTTLLLSAPIPALMFVNYAHQMPAGQRHEPTTFPKASRCALYYRAFPRCVFITAARHFQGRAGVSFITAARHFQGRAGVSFITAARHFQGQAGVSFITAAPYFQGRAGVSFTTAALLRVVF